MQFTRIPDGAPLDRQPSTATGVPRLVLGRRDLQLEPEDISDGAGRLDGIRPAGLLTTAPPAGRLPLATQHNGSMPWLGRDGVEQPTQLLLRRPPRRTDDGYRGLRRLRQHQLRN